MKKTILNTLLVLGLGAFATAAQAQTADFNVVPRPMSVVESGTEAFFLTDNTHIYCAKTKVGKQGARFLQQFIHERAGIDVPFTAFGDKALRTLAASKQAPVAGKQAIYLLTEEFGDNPEAYRISVTEKAIVITGASDAGLFYGIQTLRKALPHYTINPNNPQLKMERKIEVPAVSVVDAPRFSYRGAHLDVSRHFVTPDSVRRFIDMLALHNINRFHWHLTEDQGWRLEIKKYPRLTTVGSVRSETVIGHNSGKYDGIPYGGFYTQKECKAIVKYAAERGVTIIPEIDLPGHMQGALAAYPELGCTGGPYEVWCRWGVSEDVLCAGNDKTLKFIDDVLDEVCKIFPSEYIHVGGDECPKTRWKDCPKCQARIKAEGLEARDGHTAEERLQSYVIRHAEAHLAKRGRKMIGWDETLEGGLADGATVMSWRGEAGGIEAARQKHDVIMTPNTYLYFDYYQSLDTKNEPDAIGGYLPLERVYSYEPVSDAMAAEGLGKYIVGVQANCWTEYMPNYRQMEYMELPRMAALAEIQWTQRGTKDYDDFCNRTLTLIGLYDEMGYNYAKHIFDPKARYTVDTEKRKIVAEYASTVGGDVFYTVDGSEPDRQSAVYNGPIALDGDAQLRACTFRVAERRPHSSAVRMERSNVLSADFVFSKATASPTFLVNEPAHQYKFNGGMTLVDGVQGMNRNYQSGQWLGFNGADLEVWIDLGSVQTVSSVSINTNVAKGDWVFDVTGLEVSAADADAPVTAVENCPSLPSKSVAAATYAVDDKDAPDGIRNHALTFAPVETRYLRVKASCLKELPAWHGGKGKPAFIFVDEVMVK